MENIESYRIGEDSGDIEVARAAEIRQLVLAMARQATRRIYITSHELDPAIYDHNDLVDAVSAMVRNHRNAEVCILIRESNATAQYSHRLVTLAQRLSSRIHIHNPDEMHAKFNTAVFIADDRAYLRRPLGDRYEGIANFNAPMQVRELADDFNEMWQRSTPDPQLRRLHI